MTECLSMPNILWRIKNFSLTHKKLSPTIRFVGLKFHMILSQYVESGAEKLQLNLECHNTSQALALQPYKFNVDVSIVRNNGFKYMSKNGVYDLTANEWCIWTEFIPSIYKTLGRINGLTFLIKITPSEDFEEIFSTIKSGKFFLHPFFFFSLTIEHFFFCRSFTGLLLTWTVLLFSHSMQFQEISIPSYFKDISLKN